MDEGHSSYFPGASGACEQHRIVPQMGAWDEGLVDDRRQKGSASDGDLNTAADLVKPEAGDKKSRWTANRELLEPTRQGGHLPAGPRPSGPVADQRWARTSLALSSAWPDRGHAGFVQGTRQRSLVERQPRERGCELGSGASRVVYNRQAVSPQRGPLGPGAGDWASGLSRLGARATATWCTRCTVANLCSSLRQEWPPSVPAVLLTGCLADSDAARSK